MALPTPPAKGKRGQPGRPVQGVEAGDEVYVTHPARGPLAVRVLAHGRDGLTGVCERGERHQLPWSAYLGHRRRMLQRWNVVDQGADGALLDDGKGGRRFLAGELPAPADGAPPRAAETDPADDPLLSGMGRLTKAETAVIPDGACVLFLKGGPIANRAGLALRPVTDRAGHRTQRWSRTAPKETGQQDGKAQQDPDAPPLRHGDTVQFRHGDVGGEGKITGSGRDGVTVQDAEGNEHQVRHEHLVKPGGGGGASAGQDAESQGDAAAPAQARQGGGAGQPGADAGAKPPVPENPPPLFPPEAVKGLPAVASQPTADRADLMTKSAAALDHLQSWLDKGKGVCSQLGYQTMDKGMEGVDWSKPGGMLFIAPLKGEKRAAEKVESDYGGDWSKLLDTVRCSIAVDRYDEIGHTVAALQKSGMKLARQPKDRFHKALPVGYRDLMLNVELPNGIIGEVQVHVKPMLQAKEAGHKHYETERRLQSKKGTGLSDAEAKELDQSIAAQTDIYNAAWAASVGGAAQGAEMRKSLEGDAFSYFEHDNAYFRRRNQAPFRAVDDVLDGDGWKPYQGADSLAPALFGDEVGDPLAKGGPSGGEQMAKGGPLALFFKAQIPGGAAGDLFAATVPVKGHMRDGRYVAPFAATRHKRASRVPIADTEARRIAGAVFAQHAKRPSGTSVSFAGMLGAWQHATRHGEIHPDDEDAILRHMKEVAAERAREVGSKRATAAPLPLPPREDASAPMREREAAIKRMQAEPAHLRDMRGKLALYEGARYMTASQEAARDLYRARLGADPAKWKVGHGVSYQVASGGRRPQTNRGFRITAVHPEDLQATIRSVADTGLTTTGGDRDRIGDQRIYLGELRRDQKRDG